MEPVEDRDLSKRNPLPPSRIKRSGGVLGPVEVLGDRGRWAEDYLASGPSFHHRGCPNGQEGLPRRCPEISPIVKFCNKFTHPARLSVSPASSYQLSEILWTVITESEKGDGAAG